MSALVWDGVADDMPATYEVARLRAERDELAAALLLIEAHHRDLNRKAGRPEERSYTLRVVRAALAKLKGAK